MISIVEHRIDLSVHIEAPDEARLEVRTTAFMLGLVAALDQPGVRLEWVGGDADSVMRFGWSAEVDVLAVAAEDRNLPAVDVDAFVL